MKKGLIIGLAALLVLGLAAGMGSATIIQTNTVNTNGIVTITQFGNYDVVFQNTLRVGTGILNFNQDISTWYGNFANDVRLRSGTVAGDLRIDNYASEQSFGRTQRDIIGDDLPPYSVKPHREIAFNQQIYMGESNWDYDAAHSVQKFSNMPGYIEQEIKVYPLPPPHVPNVEPDTLNLWTGNNGQFGVLNSTPIQPVLGGRAYLQQEGSARADYDFAGQYSNLGGTVTGTIVAVNNTNWVDLTQIIQYQ